MEKAAFSKKIKMRHTPLLRAAEPAGEQGLHCWQRDGSGHCGSVTRQSSVLNAG